MLSGCNELCRTCLLHLPPYVMSCRVTLPGPCVPCCCQSYTGRTANFPQSQQYSAYVLAIWLLCRVLDACCECPWLLSQIKVHETRGDKEYVETPWLESGEEVDAAAKSASAEKAPALKPGEHAAKIRKTICNSFGMGMKASKAQAQQQCLGLGACRCVTVHSRCSDGRHLLSEMTSSCSLWPPGQDCMQAAGAWQHAMRFVDGLPVELAGPPMVELQPRCSAGRTAGAAATWRDTTPLLLWRCRP